jgi:KUP system potassium uptake protein
VITEPAPFVRPEKGVEVRDLGNGFFRVRAHVGFMQTPNVPELLLRCAPHGIATNPMSTTYYLGRETLLSTGTTKMARLRKHLFSFLSRNARPPSGFFSIPPNRVVELGTQIEF